MPTTKAKRSAAAKKGAETKKNKGDVPKPFDDLNTAEDSQAVPGHFVEVISGDHKGRYGVLIEEADKDNVIIRTRDENSERLVVKYADLEPSRSGKR